MTADPPAEAGGSFRGLPQPLPAAALTNACDPSAFTFDDTAALQAQDVPPGQDRVLEAVGFASGMLRIGYNLYVMGSPGVGKHRLIDALLQQRAAEQPAPSDWCYVANIERPDAPEAPALPAGRGERLRDDMRQQFTGSSEAG